MNEKVVYGLLALITKITPLIDKSKTPPPQVINRKNFTQSCCLSEDSKKAIRVGAFTFQMLFHGKREASLDYRL
jgi:hypothetical protein